MLNRFIKDNDIVVFFAGLVMMVVGGYFFMQNVEVTTATIFQFSLWGRRMDGLIFVPLIASIVFLFFKYNTASKVCCLLSMLIIIANVLVNLRIWWNATSLFATIVIFVLMFGGLGLVLRTVFANPEGKHGKKYKEENDSAHSQK